MLPQLTTYLLVAAIQCVHVSQAIAPRNCFSYEGSVCNPDYLCNCCSKLFFEDGTNGGVKKNVGLFCNMKHAIVIDEGSHPDPYPQGCCQRCMSEGDGCTNEMNPCCPDHRAVPDASCPRGQTKCQRTSASPTYKNGDAVYLECRGKIRECYGENMFCNGRVWKCCDGLICNTGGDRNAWGVCQRNGSLVSPMPKPPGALPQPLAPLDPKCYNYRNTTDATTEATPGAGNNGYCAAEGHYCDFNYRACCAGLHCPDYGLIWRIVRWILNLLGIWYRVCRR